MGKKIKVTGELPGFLIDKSGKTWIFDKHCNIDSTSNGIRVQEGVTRTKIVLEGTSQASFDNTFAAIIGTGDGCSITIAKGAKALGPFGAIATGDGSHIDNLGTSNSIRISGDGSVATNSGRIISDFSGLAAWEADGCKLVNEKSGRIDVSLDVNIYASAMRLNTLEGQSGTAINHGVILSGIVSGGLGEDRFINRGKVNNDVAMFDGDDRIDNRGGIVKGIIAGGQGDDTLITDKATDILQESDDQGIDTVRSTVSYTLSANVEVLRLIGKANINGTATDTTATREYLFGNAGANMLKGLGGRDVLDGGKGRDTLVGGGDLDLFVFKKGYGIDTIRDFHPGEGDIIILEKFSNLGDVAKLQSRIEQHGADAWLRMGKHDILILKDVDGDALTNADFGW